MKWNYWAGFARCCILTIMSKTKSSVGETPTREACIALTVKTLDKVLRGLWNTRDVILRIILQNQRSGAPPYTGGLVQEFVATSFHCIEMMVRALESHPE